MGTMGMVINGIIGVRKDLEKENKGLNGVVRWRVEGERKIVVD